MGGVGSSNFTFVNYLIVVAGQACLLGAGSAAEGFHGVEIEMVRRWFVRNTEEHTTQRVVSSDGTGLNATKAHEGQDAPHRRRILFYHLGKELKTDSFGAPVIIRKNSLKIA